MDFTESNRRIFNDMASKYDGLDWQKNLNSLVMRETRDRLDWFGVDWIKDDEKGKEVRLLDYACGTGLMSRILGPHVTTIRGIDLSSNMAAEFNSRATAAGFSPERMSAVQGNLASSEPQTHLADPAFFDFDAAVVGAAFHHFDDVFLATQRITERLKPGGVFFIVDFVSDHGQHVPDEFKNYVKVYGFNESGMRSLFEEAGLIDFGFSVVGEKAVMVKESGEKFERTLFIAKGKKPTN